MEILDQLISLRSMAILSKGAIFLEEEEKGVLALKAQRGFSEGTVNFLNKISVDEGSWGVSGGEHRIAFEDCQRSECLAMGPHDHCRIPIILDNQVVGLIDLYVKNGYKSKKITNDFLVSISNIVTTMIAETKEAELSK